MAYFFNHYNILFLMNLHSLSKSNTNSTQILGFIVMTVFYNWPFPHVYFANNVKGKGKVFPYSLPSFGPGADPGVQAVSPQVT